jgi:hypothetical protein
VNQSWAGTLAIPTFVSRGDVSITTPLDFRLTTTAISLEPSMSELTGRRGGIGSMYSSRKWLILFSAAITLILLVLFLLAWF